MSYTRRMGNYPKQNTPVSSVGQRRPNMGNPHNTGPQRSNNLQPGFQNKQQQMQQQQQPQQNQVQQQYQSQVQQDKPKPNTQPMNQQPKVQQQQQQPPVQTPPQPLIQKPPQQISTPTPAPPVQKPQVPQQQPPPANMQQSAEQILTEQSFKKENEPVITSSAVELPGLGNGNPAPAEGESGVTVKAKPFWMKRNGRVNRAERTKKRNVRLRKLLQPKNALMIINELVGHVTFDLTESKSGSFEDVFKASLQVEGDEYSGVGKSKPLAKSAAAEAAVRSMILKKLKITATVPTNPEDENKDVKMEVVNDEENQDDVSWTHIASFAIHKLFSSWGDDGNMADMMSRSNSMVSIPDGVSSKDGTPSFQPQPEQRPAKKLPDNAGLMNPIMLLNQMHPSAKYEELGKSGTPPNTQFTIRCTIDTNSFVGTGQNKKAARKQAAFEACKTLLGIQYPPDILEGTVSGKQAVPMETA